MKEAFLILGLGFRFQSFLMMMCYMYVCTLLFAIKFMELNALGNPHPRMDGMTDDLVDIMRKQFAMD
ncbi:unnamed protein product [Brassica oleracea var. botrytis]